MNTTDRDVDATTFNMLYQRPRQSGKTTDLLNEMRKKIMEQSRGREMFNATSHLIRQVFDAADYQGLSGEDRYTMLAFHALEALTQAQKTVRELLIVTPSPRLVVQRESIHKPDGIY